MSKSLTNQEARVASTIAELAYRANSGATLRAAHKARQAAEDLATEVAALAMMDNEHRLEFVGTCGRKAAALIRKFA